MNKQDIKLETTKNNTLKHWVRFARHAFFYALLLTISPASLSAQITSILILEESNKGFSKKLSQNISDKIIKKHSNAKIHKKNLADQPDIENISTHDIIVTLGNKPAEYILRKKIKKPVISLLITERAIKLLNKTYAPKNTWTTISLNQPIKRQLLLIKHLLGDKNVIGTIFGPVSQKNREETKIVAKELSLKLVNENILITDQLISSLKNLTSKSDVILAIPDPVAFNKKTIRGILLLTYRKKIPIIGFSKSYVKAGALAAIYSSSEQISKQASEIINNFINTKLLTRKNHAPKYFSVAINKKMAHTFNIKTINNEKLVNFIKRDEKLK